MGFARLHELQWFATRNTGLAYNELRDADGGGDEIAPSIVLVSPIAEGLIDPGESFVLNVSDASGIAYTSIFVVYPGRDKTVVWTSEDGAEPGYTVTQEGSAESYLLVIRRDDGWEESPTFQATTVDMAGNVL